MDQHEEHKPQKFIQDHLATFHTLLSRHGLQWLISDNQKISIQHVLSVVRPALVKERLESDISFFHHKLINYLNGFMHHAVNISELFQLTDSGKPSRKCHKENNFSRSGNSNNSNHTSHTYKSENEDNTKAPVCLWEYRRQKKGSTIS